MLHLLKDIRKLLWCTILSTLALIFVQNSFAQYRELRLGVGYASGYFIARELEDEGFIFHDSQFSILKNELVKYAEFSLPVDKRMTIQITGAYGNFTFLNTYSYGKKIENEYRQFSFTTGLRYYYFSNATKQCKLYSSLNFGLSFKKQRTAEYTSNDKIGVQYTDNEFNSAIHLNAIGISMGKKFGVYAELGYGFKGIVNAGIFLRP